MANKKEALMDATMQVISETGFGGFSMKRVTELAGVGETLVYKHFETKENLLYECFRSFHDDLVEFVELYSLDEVKEQFKTDGVMLVLKKVWMDYLDFLVRNKYRTVYYFEYRDSLYINNILEKRRDFYQEHLADFEEPFKLCAEQFDLQGEDKQHIFWSYMLDTYGMFARRIITGEISDTPESREWIWEITSKGVSGLLKK